MGNLEGLQHIYIHIENIVNVRSLSLHMHVHVRVTYIINQHVDYRLLNLFTAMQKAIR